MRPPPLSTLPAGRTFRLELAPCPAPTEERDLIDVRVRPNASDQKAAEHVACEALRAAYTAAGEPCGARFEVVTTEAGERYSLAYVGAYRVWMRDLRPDADGLRRILKLAASQTTDSSVQAWLTNDEEGTWRRLARELADEAAKMPKADELSLAQIEAAIADALCLRALEATVRHVKRRKVTAQKGSEL